jgi:ABC-type Zn uptake system ZnuABC Zn-binding protein ZnuA
VKALLIVLMAATCVAAQEEKKKVSCTLHVLKVIADELGGADFDISALSPPDRDAHAISPTPVLIDKLRKADVFIEVGLQLELWADQVVEGSTNPKVAKGAPGHIVASAGVTREEVPKIVSREQGDVHPEGNPHIWLDPIRIKQVAENIADGLKIASPDKKDAVDERLKKFKSRIDEALFGADLLKEVKATTLTRKALDGTLWSYLEEKKLTEKAGGWLKKAAPLRGVKVVEFHKTWVYDARLFGFEIVGSVQPKPGIEPGPKDLSDLVEKMKAEKVRIIIVDNFYNPANPRKLAEATGAKVAIVPNQPGGEKDTDDYFKFMDHVLDKLVEAAK